MISKTTTAKKSLGQNFLTNKNKIREIISALEPQDGDTVVEIGPGHGELTKELRIWNKELRIIAVEKDERLARELQKEIGNAKTEIIAGDVLKILPAITKNYKLKTKSYKIIGNIPYYITGYLLRILGELKHKPKIIVLTVQKEVAERICAGMNPLRGRSASKGMNLLAASVQFWAEPEIVGFISKNDFSPQTKVDSAIIKLTTNNHQPTTKEAENYYLFIKALFKQPRKTILNNLLAGYAIPRGKLVKILELVNINPNDRPQNLGLNDLLNFLYHLEKTASDNLGDASAGLTLL